MLEDLGPVEHDLEVSIERLELLAAGDGVWQHPDEVANVCGKLHEVEALDVIESGKSIVSKRLQIGHAALELSAVVVAGEAHNEASSEVGNKGVQRRQFEALKSRSRHHDGANHKGQKVGSGSARLEVKSTGPVGLDGGNVGLDLSLVEEVVLGDDLCELSWVLEDLSPGLDGLDVISHSPAGVESLRNLERHDGELKSGLEVIVPTSHLNS